MTNPAARTPLLRERLIGERARISARVDSLRQTMMSLDDILVELGDNGVPER